MNARPTSGKARSRGLLAAIALIHALAGAGAACAGEATAGDGLHGRVAVQDVADVFPAGSLASASGAGIADDAAADLRLGWAHTWGPLRVEVQDLVTVQAGPEIPLAREEAAIAPAPPATWVGLTTTIADRGRVRAIQTIDRLSLTYSGSNLVVRVGRQALTWGSGLVFRPLDLFVPFSPSAIDTEYKPGADMLYVQKLFADGSDLEIVAALRPPRAGAGPSGNASSFAVHYRRALAGLRTTWILARDHGDWTGGLGLNGALGGASWNVEIAPTAARLAGTEVSVLANISEAVTLAGRNATVFGEYFHNGFGASGAGLTHAALPAPLTDRLARGQLFQVRRDYLASGLSVELTPLINAGPTLIVDLNDASLLLLASATWSLRENLTLVGGVQAPLGGRGTEFGGLPISPANPLRLAPPVRIYLSLRRYF